MIVTNCSGKVVNATIFVNAYFTKDHGDHLETPASLSCTSNSTLVVLYPTQEEVARLVSKSRSAITNTLRLLDLPDEVQQLMSEGKLTAGHARAILAVPSEEGRIRLAEKVVAQGLSVRQTETLAPLFSDNSHAEQVHRQLVPQSFKRAARQMRLALDTNVKVKTVRGRNKVEIEFEDEDALAHLVDLLTRD